jgi:hypothetical protein
MARTQIILTDAEGFDRWPDTAPVATAPWVEAMRRRSISRRRRAYYAFTTGPGELVETPYVASGGLSSLIQLDDEELQVEIHRDSFSLLWSTDLLADSVIRNILPMLPGVPLEVEVAYVDGLAVEREPAAAMRAIARGEDARQVAYLRLQYEDRVVSWEQRRVDLIGSSRWFVAGQVGFVADQLDAAYIESMIVRTASRRLAPIAPHLASRVAKVVGLAERFPARAFEETGRWQAGGGEAFDAQEVTREL